MNIQAVRTHKIQASSNLLEIIKKYLPVIKERSIVVITSKIVSICEGRVINKTTADKDELIIQEAQYYLPRASNLYNIMLTITHGMLIPTAGIDESNGLDHYILWPNNPQRTANNIRKTLVQRYGLKEVGVIITDSKTTPLRLGTTGIALAHSGFKAIKNYIGKKDIYGEKLKMTQANLADGLAAAAVLVMGEGDEQTPLAIINDLSFIDFQHRNPTSKELKSMAISKDSDIYSKLINGVKWQKGGNCSTWNNL
ncbi:MAG: hypothetical protein UT48_C0001G0077 [Parcubacteria group bacterium GW2011_GWE2_39_37]|uniref:Coenzyme F420:L-glutamate ligase-like domain-containing protein n=1 Tax=Candidatus Falkowbacteria bacterium GW2011_GWF2_39_8 TaxID=1618642 RepID=A0A0G0Q062_9BACT|nr:MAG: hypothetical protein UT48_C0001G0077 [Parcubacteria group bacterium GW2011_GWE2_39_37]KKR33714.1 MAG: hypothetical protein UT64_C0004G0021 [Candidatus Falkowbacteria bacterium GW2011_GWF2_39_8]